MQSWQRITSNGEQVRMSVQRGGGVAAQSLQSDEGFDIFLTLFPHHNRSIV